MSMSSSELKHILRKTDFPFCARETLVRVEQICASQSVGRTSGSKHVDLTMEIISEFVFCEIDRRGGRKRRLNCIQELQLLEVLCDYFAYSGNSNDAVRNTVFMSLFPPTHTERSRLLTKLVSMAISTKNIPVLTATGIWMQQLGCTSKFSLDLAQGLVKDYFVLIPKAVSGLQDLPQLAPQFTANFLTAVAEMYGVVEKRQIFSPPPETLLEVITQWVSDNPTLCLAALLVNLHLSLPLGGIPMAAITPFAGLFKWCVLAPLHYASPSGGTPGNNSDIPTSDQKSSESPLYSHLHLALLESLLECYSPSPGLHHTVTPARENMVLAQHLAAIAEPISRWLKEFSKTEDEVARSRGETALHLALDRLAQVIQVALVTHCVYGNIQELLSQLELLPENRLLRIVIKTHRS
ncbi:integrator complex subunit 15 isoform X1 [Periplaneta americana]|uniref:integrator complex subunit 15 isoform X1 n=2 Tax=Periplaneta americana TaxID=6978 RepID=UPI0037E93D68